MLSRYREGGVIAREIVASRVQAPPAFFTEAKVAKGGVYLWDSTVHTWIACHRHLQSCVGTQVRLGYAAFDAQLRKMYFVTTLYAIRTSVGMHMLYRGSSHPVLVI